MKIMASEPPQIPSTETTTTTTTCVAVPESVISSSSSHQQQQQQQEYHFAPMKPITAPMAASEMEYVVPDATHCRVSGSSIKAIPKLSFVQPSRKDDDAQSTVSPKEVETLSPCQGHRLLLDRVHPPSPSEHSKNDETEESSAACDIETCKGMIVEAARVERVDLLSVVELERSGVGRTNSNRFATGDADAQAAESPPSRKIRRILDIQESNGGECIQNTNTSFACSEQPPPLRKDGHASLTASS
jgi:hypothetical protein